MLLCFILFFALVLFWILGRKKGFSRKQLTAMAWEKCKKSLIVVTVIAMIGVITGIWRMSGTVAGCIVWGVSIITPQLFVVIALLLWLIPFCYLLTKPRFYPGKR